MSPRSIALGVLLLFDILNQPVWAAGQQVGLTFYVPGRPPATHFASWTPGTTVEQAMRRAGIKYVTGWWPRLGSGLLVAEGVPLFTNGELSSPFWLLCIDGKSANAGMTKAQIPTWRSKIEWFWTTQQACKPQQP